LVYYIVTIYMSRVEELNQRLRDRNVADVPPFYFSPRPVPTKYCTFPIVDSRVESSVPIRKCSPYSTSTQFLPATSAPWSGKASSIDVESKLHYTKDYIPSSKSSLYQSSVPSQQGTQPHPLLFASVRAEPVVFKPDRKSFNNATRIKNIS
jgi:hypothetical protein